MEKKELLQKYVDHKLNSIRCDCDDLSDYLENYTDNKNTVYKENIEKWGFTCDNFIADFKPTEQQIRIAIKNSKFLNVLAERYKQAVIKTIPIDIYYHEIDNDKCGIAETLEEELYEQKQQEILKSARKKN